MMIVFLSVLLCVPFYLPETTSAASADCGYVVKNGVNPTFQQTNCLLTNAALKHDVPPEIVKAVATQEESGWKQFDDSGKPIISGDGGIGIMQITTDAKDVERLKTDITYNIDQGVKRLADNFYKRNDLPKINDHSPTVLEHWYFAVMAYNGTKPVNSPIAKCDGPTGTNLGAYQEQVYKNMEIEQLVATKVGVIPFDSKDFGYECGSSDNIVFNKKQYTVTGALTETSYLLKANDYALTTANGVNVRKESSTSSTRVTTLGKNQMVKITGDFRFEINETSSNQFAFMPVNSDGKYNGYIASTYLKKIGTRISGDSRFHTANEISNEGWDTADTIILARSDNFPDALAGAPLAYAYNAPILLTETKKLDQREKNEINRLGAKNVIILGGYPAVGKEVENDLKRMNLNVKRIEGSGRYETAVEIAKELESKLGKKADKAIVVSGQQFPDALAIASYAAQNGYPIFLTEKGKMMDAVQKEVNSYKQKLIVGGEAVVGTEVAKQINNPKRIAGSGRYQTAANIIRELNLPTDNIFFATGGGFPDALTGSVLAAKRKAPLLLVQKENLHDHTSALLKERNMTHFNVLGGDAVVNEQVISQLFNSMSK